MALPKKEKPKEKYYAGRPRSTTPEDEEIIELGKELVAWATEEIPLVKGKPKEIRCRFAQWYSLVKGMTTNQWDLLVKQQAFCVYHEQARTALAQRHIDGTIHPSIAHRFMRHYVPEVKFEENEQVATEAALKIPDTAQASPELMEKHESLMKQLQELRQSMTSGKKPS